MSAPTETLTEREEIEMLLPWYVTGRLDAADRKRVEAALQREPALRRQLDLVREEQSVDIRENEAVRLPATLSVESFMATAPKPRITVQAMLAALSTQVRNFFTMPTVGAVRWATAAAAVVILAQAAVLGSLVSSQTPASYQSASGGTTQPQTGSFALVRFADTATIKELTSTLAEFGMAIVESPRAGSLYRVRMSAATLKDAERDAALAKLRSLSGLVLLATPSS